MKIKNKLGNLARLGNLASRDVHVLLARFPNLAPYRNIYLNFIRVPSALHLGWTAHGVCLLPCLCVSLY